MTGGAWAIRWTVRLALCCSLAGAWAEMPAQAGDERRRLARAAWTAGWALFLAHVVCAFQFEHHWSHAAAYRHTAHRTAELVGWEWGGGLYLNYAFTAAWTADTLGRWRRLAARRPPGVCQTVWCGWFLFMVVNGAIVFASGPVRWAAVSGLAALAAMWVRQRRSDAR